MSKSMEQLHDYAKKIVKSGLVVGAGGNISIRDGEFMYISPSGYGLDEITEDKWVKVHIETGEIIGSIKPSSEVLMHLVCYRKRNDISAVLHAHPTYSVAVSSTRHEIPSMFPDFPAMVKTIAYLDYIIPTTHLLADAVDDVITDTDAIVMRNHGVLTVGKTMKEAFFYMQIIEEAAKVFLLASTLEKPRVLTEEECADLRNLSSEKFRSELLKKQQS